MPYLDYIGDLAFGLVENDDNKPLFRLLQIHKLIGDEIHCSLRVATIEGAQYRAISYMWDMPTEVVGKRHTIWIDGKEHAVRQNLCDFLRYAKKQYQGEDLWIDFVCIDQRNDRERSHQVELMARIYRNAIEVISWLGRGDFETDAFMYCAGMKTVPKYDHFPVSKVSLFEQAIQLGLFEDNQPRVSIAGHQFSTIYNGCKKILTNPYWRRMWIVQEVMLARRIIIACGPYDVPLQAITTPLREAREVEGEIQRKLGADAMAVLTSRETMARVRQLSLGELMQKFGQQECSIVADRLYALLGLRSNAGNLIVDYSRGRAELARYVLTHIHCTDFLYGPLMVRAVGVPIDTADSCLTPKFCTACFQCYAEHPYAVIESVDVDDADDLAIDTELPEIMHNVFKRIKVVPCSFPECRMTTDIDRPRPGDIVLKLPRMRLRAVFRPLYYHPSGFMQRTPTELSFVCFISKEFTEKGKPIYSYCSVALDLEDHIRKLIPKVREWDHEEVSLSWKLNWRTIFMIWKYTSFEDFLLRREENRTHEELDWKHD